MASVINAEWLNQNSQRAFPFQENMRRRPTVDGVLLDDYAIPDGLLLDLILATNFDPQPEIYLSSLTFAGAAATLVISNVADNAPLAVVAAPVSNAEYTPVNFSGAGTHDDIRGTAVFGNLGRLSESFPEGIYSFDPGETRFEARCCRPSVPCVSGLYLADATGGSGSTRLRGDVALVAGTNIRLDYNENDNAIVISADSRYSYNEKCDCEAKDRRQPVMQVNGISADSIEIEGGDCVEVTRREGRLIISDTCSKPCCGCAELTFLNQKTNEITTSLGKLSQFSNELHSRLDDFIRNVLLSERNLSEFI